MMFYLGAHMPSWLHKPEIDFPLFISRRRLLRYKKPFKEAMTNWALDSGAFTELNMFGEWRTSVQQYAKEVKRYQEELGHITWASCQDWMCEPFVLAKTGKTVQDHQRLTIDNYLEIKNINPDLPIAPVLQGWEIPDYLDHVNQYYNRGVDLTKEKIVGLGSVCRRQNTDEAEELVKILHGHNIKLHGFGFKILGLKRVKDHLASSDSMSWCLNASKQRPPYKCPLGNKSCSNCLHYAIEWRNKVMEIINA